MKETNEIQKVPTVNIDKIKALGNRERIKILEVLIRKGPMSWTTLQQELQMNPNSLNFHLTKLLHSEFISREVKENEKGRPSTLYSVLPEGKTQYQLISQLSR